MSTTACTVTSHGSRRAGQATRSRSSPSSDSPSNGHDSRTGDTRQLVLRRERDVIDGIAFGRPDLAGTLSEGDRVDVVARLASRMFGGMETLQLEIRDVSTSGAHPRAAEVLEFAAGRRDATPVGPGAPAIVNGGVA